MKGNGRRVTTAARPAAASGPRSPRTGRTGDRGIDVPGQVAQGDHGVPAVREVFQEGRKLLRPRRHPVVGGARRAVELEDGDLAALRLTHRRLEVVEGPGRAGVPGGGVSSGWSSPG